MSTEYIPYTYLIGWSRLNKWYYGSRSANTKRNIANPNDLFKTYFTSSKVVKRYIEIHGQPDIVQIRRVFATGNEAKNWEVRVLKRIKYLKSKFINLNFGGSDVILKGPTHPMYGKTHTNESKQKISDNHTICSGSYNSNAKTFLIETPCGRKIICNGNLKEECKKLNISFSTVRLILLAKGRDATSGSCVGYKVSRLI